MMLISVRLKFYDWLPGYSFQKPKHASYKPVLEMLDKLFVLFSNSGRLLLKEGSTVSDSPSISMPVSVDTTAFLSVLLNPPATTVAVATIVAFRVPLAILK